MIYAFLNGCILKGLFKKKYLFSLIKWKYQHVFLFKNQYKLIVIFSILAFECHMQSPT